MAVTWPRRRFWRSGCREDLDGRVPEKCAGDLERARKRGCVGQGIAQPNTEHTKSGPQGPPSVVLPLLTTLSSRAKRGALLCGLRNRRTRFSKSLNCHALCIRARLLPCHKPNQNLNGAECRPKTSPSVGCNLSVCHELLRHFILRRLGNSGSCPGACRCSRTSRIVC